MVTAPATCLDMADPFPADISENPKTSLSKAYACCATRETPFYKDLSGQKRARRAAGFIRDLVTGQHARDFIDAVRIWQGNNC